jgi:hypothetical protein
LTSRISRLPRHNCYYAKIRLRYSTGQGFRSIPSTDKRGVFVDHEVRGSRRECPRHGTITSSACVDSRDRTRLGRYEAGRKKTIDNPREARTTGQRISRRTFLKGTAALGVASLGTPLFGTTPASAAKKDPTSAATTVTSSTTPINHIIICSQENRSLDHYYGYASAVQNAGYHAGDARAAALWRPGTPAQGGLARLR